MPKSTASFCSSPDCGNLTRNKGKCDACRRKYDKKRGNPGQRGYGYQWRKIRGEFLLENPLCVVCGAPATEVDHIDGNPRNNDPSNWRQMCKSDHSRRTARDQSFKKRRNQNMAKRGPKPKTETQHEKRSSFLPTDPAEIIEERVAKEKTEDEILGLLENPVTVRRVEPTRLEIRLELPPLRPCVETIGIETKSVYQLCALIGASLQRLGQEAASDGINQHVKKETEERESAQRYEAHGRPPGING